LEVRKRLPEAIFTVLDRFPDYDVHQLRGDHVSFRQDYTIRGLYAGKLRRLLSRMIPATDRLAVAAANVVRSASAVVASGGDVFCSEYGHRSLLSHLKPLEIACKAGVPVILHAQSIGPFTNEEDRSAFLRIARQAAAITVREAASYKYVIGDLQLREDRCHLVADPAFLLGQPDPEEGERLFKHHRAREDRPTVALSTSEAICHWKNSDGTGHLDTWLEIVRWLRSELKANVILIPHVQEISPLNDDRVLATEIQRRLGYDDGVRLAGGNFSAEEFKAIISRCDFLVAERMHAAIAGLSTGVPTLVVGYSIKAKGILSDLLGPELTESCALIPLEDFLKPGAGAVRAKEAWENRDTLAASLRESLPAARERATEAFNILQRAINTKPD
jgi:colanic acid/amylovoran biosynthesis protein